MGYLHETQLDNLISLASPQVLKREQFEIELLFERFWGDDIMPLHQIVFYRMEDNPQFWGYESEFTNFINETLESAYDDTPGIPEDSTNNYLVNEDVYD